VRWSRLFTTLVRFDAAYVPIMHCNLKQIRYDYPLLHAWLRRLYWEEDEEARGAFQSTTFFNEVSCAVLFASII
jgi:putative glutathione S-transferase